VDGACWCLVLSLSWKSSFLAKRQLQIVTSLKSTFTAAYQPLDPVDGRFQARSSRIPYFAFGYTLILVEVEIGLQLVVG